MYKRLSQFYDSIIRQKVRFFSTYLSELDFEYLDLTIIFCSGSHFERIITPTPDKHYLFLRGRNTLPKFFQESVLKISDAEHEKTSLHKLISSWDKLQGTDLIKISIDKMQGTILEKNWWGNYLTWPNSLMRMSRIPVFHPVMWNILLWICFSFYTLRKIKRNSHLQSTL